jgi:hypothetical protein
VLRLGKQSPQSGEGRNRNNLSETAPHPTLPFAISRLLLLAKKAGLHND